MMRFELKKLTDYSDESLIAELSRVASELNGQRLTIERFDSLSRVHSATVRTRFGSWAAALDLARISESLAPRRVELSRDKVLSAIKRYAGENGIKSPTRDLIAMHLQVNPGTITRRFGRWDKLLAEVGLEPVPLGRRHTEQECFENILMLWTYYGRQPKFAELNRPPSTVGSKAYVRRWRGWQRAIAAFVANATTDEAQEPPEENLLSADIPVVPIEPRSISLSLRYKILHRDRFRCVTCGRSPAKDGTVELHIDHIMPWSQGGQTAESNLRTLCSDCNIGKGSRIDEG